VDFRLNINGLAALVQQALGLDPFAACVYVFSSRRRNRVKILGWDRNGFWLLLRSGGTPADASSSRGEPPKFGPLGFRLLTGPRSGRVASRMGLLGSAVSELLMP